WLCGWKWIRNPWFRISHLLIIVVVATNDMNGAMCPLTTWEREWRELAGEEDLSEASSLRYLFHRLGRLSDDILFYPNIDHKHFQRLHICFALLVLTTFLFAPPDFGRMRLPFRRRVQSTEGAALAR